MPKPKTSQRDGHSIHFSAGAIVRRGDKILLLDRAKPPFGFAAPAGHVDEGEAPEAAVKREVHEETGLLVKNANLLIEEFVPWNTCSHGVEGHYWYVFECETEGEIARDNSEAKSIGWYGIMELKTLTLEPVWELWLKQLNIL